MAILLWFRFLDENVENGNIFHPTGSRELEMKALPVPPQPCVAEIPFPVGYHVSSG
jgi:hypothetical protein